MARWTRAELAAGGVVFATALAGIPIGGLSAAMLAIAGGIGAITIMERASKVRSATEADVVREAIMGAIGDPILVFQKGVVAHANSAARKLLGADIVGEAARTAIPHPAAAERIMDLEERGSVELVGLGTRKQRWEMLVVDHNASRIVHLTDRTASHAAEQMRVDFVANASHELRTPLSTILGYVETLRDDAAGGDSQTRARFLGIVFDEATRMQQLVADLISLSRIEAEKYRPPAEHVDVPHIARTVAQEVRDMKSDRSVDIDIVVDTYVPKVIGDSVQISQLLHNLVGNALRYGRAGTPVTVRLWRESPETVGFSVADEGDGIAPHHLPRLTERFYRADPGRSRALAGTGLGLAIVKHIVEHHRGRMAIDSVVGEGTTVSVFLPAAVMES
ncbi:ATP-binding protein [soil metagenome]